MYTIPYGPRSFEVHNEARYDHGLSIPEGLHGQKFLVEIWAMLIDASMSKKFLMCISTHFKSSYMNHLSLKLSRKGLAIAKWLTYQQEIV